MGVNVDSYGHASGERTDVECDRKWVCGMVMWRGEDPRKQRCAWRIYGIVR